MDDERKNHGMWFFFSSHGEVCLKREIVYRISEEFHEQSVEMFLKSMDYTHQAMVKLKKTQESVLLNGKWVYLNTKMKEGDCLRILISEEGNSGNIMPYSRNFDIVYEDEDLLVINKPDNMPIHPSLNHYEDSLANALMNHFHQQGIDFVFRCINRLDKDTTGLTIVAKHYVSAGILNIQMVNREIKRTYLAFCEGIRIHGQFKEIQLQDVKTIRDIDRTLPKQGRIVLPIAREGDSLIRRCVNEKGEYAVTNFRHLNRINGIDMMEFQLESGRTHQIRVHMSALGYPLLGDDLYGGNIQHIKRTALHAKSLEFWHPILRTRMKFEAELREDMQGLLQS